MAQWCVQVVAMQPALVVDDSSDDEAKPKVEASVRSAATANMAWGVLPSLPLYRCRFRERV